MREAARGPAIMSTQHDTTTTPARAPRARDAAPAATELEPGWEWLTPLLEFRKPRRFLTTRQARQILGCTASTVHEMISSDPPSLAAHRVSARGAAGQGHWRIHGASVLHAIWSTKSQAAQFAVPMRAATAMAAFLIHHLPRPALVLLRGLINERITAQDTSLKALGLKLPPGLTRGLAEDLSAME